MAKYYPGDKYRYMKDGKEKIITFRYKTRSHMYYAEDGERKKMNIKSFYSLGLEPLQKVGNMGRAKPVMTREEYKRRNSLVYVAEED